MEDIMSGYSVDTRHKTITFYLCKTCSQSSHQPKIAEALMGNMKAVVDTGDFEFKLDPDSHAIAASYAYAYSDSVPVPTRAAVQRQYNKAQAVLTKAIDEVLRFRTIARILQKAGE